MQKITDIYKEYKIMQNLQAHQLRVAAVAWQICDSVDEKIDKESIIIACLLHDMGNIIKSQLNYFPDFLEPEGFAYWQNVQNEYFKRYGKDEHRATLEILKELKSSKSTVELVDAIGFRIACLVAKDPNFSKKICLYADFRVGPYGVVSLTERLREGKNRYKDRPNVDFNDYDKEEKEKCTYEIEHQVFSHSKIKPEDINNESIQLYLEKLKDFEI